MSLGQSEPRCLGSSHCKVINCHHIVNLFFCGNGYNKGTASSSIYYLHCTRVIMFQKINDQRQNWNDAVICYVNVHSIITQQVVNLFLIILSVLWIFIATENRGSFYAEIPISQYVETWWRHQMETFSALLDLCARNSPVIGEFPSLKPVTRSFSVFFICTWINGWVNSREAGDLRRYRPHYYVDVMNM